MQYRTAFEISKIIDSLITYLEENKTNKLSVIAQLLNELMDFDEFTKPDCNTESFFDIMTSIHDMETCLKSSENFMQAVENLKIIKGAALQESKPLKIAFIVHEFSLWPSFQTIWESCPESIEKSIVVVYALDKSLSGEELDVYADPYRQAGYAVRTSDDYVLEIEQPDIIFYMKPYRGFHSCPEEFYVNNVKKITPYTVFVSYCLDVQGGELLQEYFYGQPFFYHVWRIIGYSSYYRDKMIERGYRDANNVVLLGHPKFDVSYKLAKEKSFVNDVWKQKVKGRKVVLWNSHFTISPGSGVGTFLRWQKTIFRYFSEHNDIVLLWRPHPLFWQSISTTKEINIEEFNELVRQLEESDNVIVDRTGDYRYAFCMSDALISDAATFLVEYAATSKPILYTIKSDGEKVCNSDYLVGVHVAEMESDVLAFLDDVRINRIDTETIRTNRKMFEKMFGRCDGMVGQRILQYVLAEMEKNILEKVKNRMLILEER